VPFISMRELLRDPKQVFSAIEENGDPFVVTRRGHPIAALIPIDPSELESSVLAAAPDLLESRHEAEHAREEGRTEPLEQVMQRLDVAEGDEAERPPSTELEDLTVQLAGLFGAPLAEEISTQAATRIAEISQMVLGAVVDDAEHEALAAREPEPIARVRAINARLFERVMHGVMAEATAGVVASLGTRAVAQNHLVEQSAEGVFGRKVAEEALERVTERVRAFNEQIVEISQETGEFSLSTYETTLRGIDAFESLAQRSGRT